MNTKIMRWRDRFKRAGSNLRVGEDVYIEHPEAMELGDHVTFMRGFYMMGRPETCRIGSHVTFYPNCFIQGSPERFLVGDHVDFFPGTYLSLGTGPGSFVEIGPHTHFAPYCVMYGLGGLSIGAYNNLAAHVVLATVGHHDEKTALPMALTGAKRGPVTLEEDVWVAANATVCPKVTVAKGCVIGANAVVTRDTEPMGVYTGIPAKRLRDR